MVQMKSYFVSVVTPPTVTNTTHVAFTANLLEHQTDIGLYQTIIFDTIEVNIGDGYSADTGIFTAPVAGTYFFLASITSHNNDFVESEIVHNGQYLNHMYSSDNDHYQEQGTNGGVIVLEKGDHVWVRNAHRDKTKVFGHKYSTFSGFLLFS